MCTRHRIPRSALARAGATGTLNSETDADQGNGTWAISGCFYSHGNELWSPQVVLTFPRGDGQVEAREIVAIAARPYVAKDHREVPFGTTVRRASLSGMRAYLVTYVR